MNRGLFFSIFALILVPFTASAESGRALAITIDDLPVVTRQKTAAARRSITERLLQHIKQSKAPVTAFVNEGKLFKDGVLIPEQVGYLKKWLETGCDLGNHTYSHLSLHDNDVQAFTGEILKGEIVTKELLSEYNKSMRYFRHPYLATGLSMEIKAEVDAFLLDHDYRIAPVSIDTSDWAFSSAYDVSVLEGDNKLRKRIGQAYVSYMEAKTEYWEKQSALLFDREIRQILLIHANSINAEYLDDLVRIYKRRGYKFISLDEALEDEAYENPDTFVRRAGISWLHRWALERGREFIVKDEPKVPQFVMDAAGLKSE